MHENREVEKDRRLVKFITLRAHQFQQATERTSAEVRGRIDWRNFAMNSNQENL